MDLFIDFTIRQLILNNVYIGHRRRFSNSSLFRLLLGERNGLYVFDVRKTFLRLKPAIRFITQLSARRARILFNNPDRRIMSIFVMQKFSYLFQSFYFTRRKLPGILTNFFRLRAGFSKKFKSLKRFPSMIFSIDAYDHHIGSEAAILGLPVLNIFDSNTNFFMNHSYNVPGNDDSFVARRFYYNVVCRAILTGLVRFAFYRRMRVFKKMKLILYMRERRKLGVDFLNLRGRLPRIYGVLKELGFYNFKFGSLQSFIVNQKSIFMAKNYVTKTNKEYFEPLPIFSEAYIPDMDLNDNKFFRHLISDSIVCGRKPKYFSFKRFARLAIKRRFKKIKSVRRRKKLCRTRYRIIKRLRPGISNLFSFSSVSLLLNRVVDRKGFGYLKHMTRRRLMKRIPFLKKLFPMFKRVCLGRISNLNFFLFRRMLYVLTRRYAFYLFSKRSKFSQGRFSVYKKLVKRIKRKRTRKIMGFRFGQFYHHPKRNKRRRKVY